VIARRSLSKLGAVVSRAHAAARVAGGGMFRPETKANEVAIYRPPGR
jgi:hypothetical protein